MSEEERLLKEAKRLPWESRLFHKNWKVRVDANLDLAIVCGSITDPSDPRLREFGPLFKKTVTDSNAPVQEKALDALIAYLSAADVDARRYAKEVCNAIVVKCLTGRPKIVEKSLAVFLLWVELEAADVFLDAMERAIQNKVSKVVVIAIDVMFQALSEFSANIIPPKRLLKMLPDLFDHQDQNVRASAKGLTLELCRWIGQAPIKAILFEKMRDTVKKELESELVNVSGTARPSRRVRSEQKRELEEADALETMGPGSSQAALPDSPQVVDEYELVDPVDILTPLEKSGFWKGVKSAKWSERKEAISELTKLASTKRISPGDFTEVCRTLKKLVTDVNVAVAVEAVQVIKNLASGLRNSFSGCSRLLLPVLLEKLKEKKAVLTDSLTQTLRTMHQSGCLTIIDIVEEVKTSVKNKAPVVRALTLNWVTFCIETSKKPIILKSYKDYVPVCIECLSDGTPDVRDASFSTLAAIAKVIGMKNIERSLEQLDEVKKKKLAELIGSSGGGPLPGAPSSTESGKLPSLEADKGAFVKKSAASMLTGKKHCQPAAVTRNGPVKPETSKNRLNEGKPKSSWPVEAEKFEAVTRNSGPVKPETSKNRLSEGKPKSSQPVEAEKFEQGASAVVKSTVRNPTPNVNRIVRDPVASVLPVRPSRVSGGYTIEKKIPNTRKNLKGPDSKVVKTKKDLQVSSGSVSKQSKLYNTREVSHGDAIKKNTPNIRKNLKGPDRKVQVSKNKKDLRASPSSVSKPSKLYHTREVSSNLSKASAISPASITSKVVTKGSTRNKATGDNLLKPVKRTDASRVMPTKRSSSSAKGQKSGETSSVHNPSMNSFDLFNIKNSKKEDRLRLVIQKYKFQEPGAEQIRGVEIDLKNFFCRGFYEQLLSADFKRQIHGLEILRKAIISDQDEVIEVLDILLRWFVIQFCKSKPTSLLKGLEFLLELFDMLKVRWYIFFDSEASIILPFLVEKVGHDSERVRRNIWDLMKHICFLYYPEKIFPYISEHLKSKNKRTRIACVEFVELLLLNHISQIGGHLKSLKFISTLILDKDEETRKASLSTLATAYRYIGEGIWKYVGKLSAPEKSLLNDTFKLKAEEMEKKNEGKPGEARAGSNDSGNVMGEPVKTMGSAIKGDIGEIDKIAKSQPLILAEINFNHQTPYGQAILLGPVNQRGSDASSIKSYSGVQLKESLQ